MTDGMGPGCEGKRLGHFLADEGEVPAPSRPIDEGKPY